MPQSSLHIAIDASRTTLARRTGTERYALELIRGLIRMESPHRITLYFRDTPPHDLFPHSDQVTQKVIPFPRMWTHLRFAWELFRDRPDVTFVPAHTLPFAYPGSAVVTVHDLGYKHFPGSHPPADRGYLDRTTRHSSNAATRILADSQATKADLVHFYKTDPHKIEVVYPGVQLFDRATESEIQDVRERHLITDPYILFVGTIHPRKNIGTLIRAFLLMLEKYPYLGSHQLVIAGGHGWMADQALAPIPTEHEDRVKLLGYVPESDLPALYSGARVFAFPSLYEGFGFPVLEAMSVGTPVLCSNTSSLPELVGDSAVVIAPLDTAQIADRLQDLLTNDVLRSGLAERGYTQAARFNWDQTAYNALQALETAASE